VISNSLRFAAGVEPVGLVAWALAAGLCPQWFFRIQGWPRVSLVGNGGVGLSSHSRAYRGRIRSVGGGGLWLSRWLKRPSGMPTARERGGPGVIGRVVRGGVRAGQNFQDGGRFPKRADGPHNNRQRQMAVIAWGGAGRTPMPGVWGGARRNEGGYVREPMGTENLLGVIPPSGNVALGAPLLFGARRGAFSGAKRPLGESVTIKVGIFGAISRGGRGPVSRVGFHPRLVMGRCRAGAAGGIFPA